MITHYLTRLLCAIAQLLTPTSNEGVLESVVASRLPIAAPGPAYAAFASQVGVAQIEVNGLPVIFRSSLLNENPSGLTVVGRGAYPRCLDTVERRAEREIAGSLSLLPYLGPRSLAIAVTLYDSDPERGVPVFTVSGWVAVRPGQEFSFVASLQPSMLDLMEVKQRFDSPANGRFWLSLGSIWEVRRAVLDMPEPKSRLSRVQMPLLVRPECGQVLFPFFAVADCTSVLWVEASPRVCGVVLPLTTYLRASTADGNVCRVDLPPEFWRRRAPPPLAPLPERSDPFAIAR